jgi:hypothetical protein
MVGECLQELALARGGRRELEGRLEHMVEQGLSGEASSLDVAIEIRHFALFPELETAVEPIDHRDRTAGGRHLAEPFARPLVPGLEPNLCPRGATPIVVVGLGLVVVFERRV